MVTTHINRPEGEVPHDALDLSDEEKVRFASSLDRIERALGGRDQQGTFPLEELIALARAAVLFPESLKTAVNVHTSRVTQQGEDYRQGVSIFSSSRESEVQILLGKDGQLDSVNVVVGWQEHEIRCIYPLQRIRGYALAPEVIRDNKVRDAILEVKKEMLPEPATSK